MSENTTIIVSKETREYLKSIGRKGESYDELLQRLFVAARTSRKWRYTKAIDEAVEDIKEAAE